MTNVAMKNTEFVNLAAANPATDAHRKAPPFVRHARCQCIRKRSVSGDAHLSPSIDDDIDDDIRRKNSPEPQDRPLPILRMPLDVQQ